MAAALTQQTTTPTISAMKRALAVSLILTLPSNGLGWLISTTGIDRAPAYFVWSVLLLLAALWWAHGPARLTWAEIGLGNRWKPSAAVGLAAGLVLAVPLVAFLFFAPVLGGPVRYGEIQNLDAIGLLWRIGLEATIATALTEEILFRGILQALWKRALTKTRALIATNVVFCLWHLWANALSLQQNPVLLPFLSPEGSQALGYIGSLVAVGAGGLLLSLMRERTQNLAGSIVTHWAAVAAMTLAVYVR